MELLAQQGSLQLLAPRVLLQVVAEEAGPGSLLVVLLAQECSLQLLAPLVRLQVLLEEAEPEASCCPTPWLWPFLLSFVSAASLVSQAFFKLSFAFRAAASFFPVRPSFRSLPFTLAFFLFPLEPFSFVFFLVLLFLRER